MSELKDFVYLCHLFGCCTKRSQGGGGNISVKDSNHLYIKASGYRLSSVTPTKGYVICDIEKSFSCFKKNIEDLSSCLVSTSNDKPSMEAFFHLLPSKYIVHIHPTFFCKYLCSNDSRSIFTKEKFPSSLYISYKKPGIELAREIFSEYSNEKVIFLENHGIILLDNSMDSIIHLYASLLEQLEKYVNDNSNTSDIRIENTLYKYTEQIAKPVYNLNASLPTEFIAISPDHFLFLKDKPLFTTKENLSIHLLQSETPSILSIDSQIYCLGKTNEQCQNKEEYLRAYFDIINNSRDLSMRDRNDLLVCLKEKLRVDKL
jgi:rhamnose utilization protein RhaD (predicted bifunctional aldolase and dehydrogenase)